MRAPSAGTLAWMMNRLWRCAAAVICMNLGKIVFPDEILKKGSNLTPEEWVVMSSIR